MMLLMYIFCSDIIVIKTRWWQLKYSLFAPRKLGKIPILTSIFNFLNGLLQPPTRRDLGWVLPI